MPPRRGQSIETYLRRTRILAALALAAFAAGIVSDAEDGDFWARHALLAGLVSSVLVVLLSVAVINEVLERRRRRRWSVLAQYVLFELIRNARMIWVGVLDLAGLLPTEETQQEFVESARRTVRDHARLVAAVRGMVRTADRRGSIRNELAFLNDHCDQVLGRWAGVMLSSDVYAEVIDRHVELAGDVSWISGLFDASEPAGDSHRHKRARSSPAVAIQSDLSGDWLADRIVVITELAEELDRGTLDLALRLVPVEWWEERLGTSA